MAARLREELAKLASTHEAPWIEKFAADKNPHSTEAASREIDSILRRRKSGEPLAYIFGNWAFREFEFFCGPGVLIPRPETEELVGLCLDWAKRHPRTIWKIADFGAGTGCLGISLALGLRKIAPSAQIKLHLVEQSPQARSYLGRNAERLLKGIPDLEWEIHEISWNQWKARALDIFVSNPPYLNEVEYSQIDASVSSFEPKAALVPEGDPLGKSAYEELLALAAKCTAESGSDTGPNSVSESSSKLVAFELGTFHTPWIVERGKTVLPAFQLRVERDMASKDRFFVAES